MFDTGKDDNRGRPNIPSGFIGRYTACTTDTLEALRGARAAREGTVAAVQSGSGAFSFQS